MKVPLILFWLFLFLSPLKAQQSFFIEGKVVDKETKEPLPAYVLDMESGKGSSADSQGYFRLTFQEQRISASLRLSVWFIGYKKKEIEAKVGDYLRIELEVEPLRAEEVIVTADSLVTDKQDQKTVTMTKMDVYSTPGAAADPLYASQILPGINSLPDSSSLLIRGGAPDEVGYFFDGIEVKHPFLSESLHEAYFSIFDNQVIENFSLSTSGFHPKYSDALSGVMDIMVKDIFAKNEGGLGLSVLGLNGYLGLPLKDWGNFIGSYNLSRSEMLTWLNNPWMNNRKDMKFLHGNALGKFRFLPDKFNTFRIYGLGDKYHHFTQRNGFRFNSRNRITALSWTLTPKKNFVARFILARLWFDTSLELRRPLEIKTTDEAWQGRIEAILDLGSHFLEFGADGQSRKIKVNILENEAEIYLVKGKRQGFYFNDKFRITDQLFANLGANLLSLDLLQNRWHLSPRLSLAYFLRRDDIIRFSSGISQQFGDYFVLGKNSNLKPKKAFHWALTYDKIKPELEIRANLYHKEYKGLFLYESYDSIKNKGHGYARGAEFFLKKKEQPYEVIFVYNFLRSKRKENDTLILSPSPFEIIHSFTGIFKWKFKSGSLGLRYSFASGRPYTPLLGREWDEEKKIYQPVWGSPYSQRYPPYNRLDISGNKSFHKFNKLIIIYFGITNVLNSKNILRYDYSDDYSLRREQHSIFGRTLFFGLYFPFF